MLTVECGALVLVVHREWQGSFSRPIVRPVVSTCEQHVRQSFDERISWSPGSVAHKEGEPESSPRAPWGKTLALLPYGPRFRETRKFFHQTIGGRAVHKWKPLVEQSAAKMILATLDAPPKLVHHIRQ